MYIKRNIRNFLFFIIAAGFLVSCDKMNATYEEFLDKGEMVYNGKPEGLQAAPGNGRIGLKWYIVSDPKITRAKVFWTNQAQIEGEPVLPGQRPGGRDSLEIPIRRGSGTDSVIIVIDHMKQGIYTFQVYMYDNKGHASIKTEVISNVYGTTFQGSIGNRPLAVPLLDTIGPNKSDLYIPWFGIAQQAVKIDLIYTDISGIEKMVKIERTHVIGKGIAWKERDTLFNFKEGTTFKYRTAFLPEVNAIDTFYTEYSEVSHGYFVPPPPPTADENLARNKKVTTSSSSGTPLTDGNREGDPSPKWQPSSGERGDLNVWFYADLGSVKDFNTTQVYFTKDPAKITYYEVLYSDASAIDANSVWKRGMLKFGAPDEEDIYQSVNSDSTAFVNLKARFIKINIGLRDQGTNINVSELEVYLKAGVPVKP
jgi:hypothetical protein